MSTASSAIHLLNKLSPEDQSRADTYGLLSRLFFAPPDRTLLQRLSETAAAQMDASAIETMQPMQRPPLLSAWYELLAVSQVMDEDAAFDEYNALFGGLGKSAVSLFGGFYATLSSEQFLADLRGQLSELGLARLPGHNTPEDHLASVFETMRLLVAGHEAIAPAPQLTQDNFLNQFILNWAVPCCNAICENSLANYYKVVAQYAITFLSIEQQALDW